MRESFVIHAEYIEDLPEEYKTSFLQYVYNYGILEQAPILEGLEKSLWVKIQRRIDGDAESYNKRVEYQKAYYNKKKLEKSASNNSTSTNVCQHLSTLKNIENVDKDNSSLQMFSPNSRRDIEFDNDNEFVYEFDSDIDIDTVTPMQKEYIKKIHSLWTSAGLPGAKDIFSFQSRDFKNALPFLKGYHSDEVLQACKNYIEVLEDESTWLTYKWTFDKFVQNKQFSNFLPDNFVKDNFKKDSFSKSVSSQKEEPEEKKPYERKTCPYCSAFGKLWFNDKKQKYVCDSCRSEFEYSIISKLEWEDVHNG